MILQLYSNPQFRIKDREGKCNFRKQRTGIWQGCPLSPAGKETLGLFQFVHDMVILYAYDTSFVGSDSRPLKLFLPCIQKHSKKYMMVLNESKHRHDYIYFQDHGDDWKQIIRAHRRPRRFSPFVIVRSRRGPDTPRGQPQRKLKPRGNDRHYTCNKRTGYSPRRGRWSWQRHTLPADAIVDKFKNPSPRCLGGHRGTGYFVASRTFV